MDILSVLSGPLSVTLWKYVSFLMILFNCAIVPFAWKYYITRNTFEKSLEDYTKKMDELISKIESLTERLEHVGPSDHHSSEKRSNIIDKSTLTFMLGEIMEEMLKKSGATLGTSRKLVGKLEDY